MKLLLCFFSQSHFSDSQNKSPFRAVHASTSRLTSPEKNKQTKKKYIYIY